MPFTKTHIADLQVFDPKVWRDDRGYFYESYNKKTFQEAGIPTEFVQDKHKGKYWTLPLIFGRVLRLMESGIVSD